MIYAYASMLSMLIGHIILIHGLQFINAFQILVLVYAFASVIVIGLAVFSRALRSRILSVPKAGKTSLGLMLMMGFNVLMFYWSLSLIGLSGMAVFTGLTTLLIVLGGVFLFKEQMNAAKILLLAASILSTVLFSFSESILQIGFWGLFAPLMATASWAMIHFQMKKLSHTMDSFAFVCARVPFIFLLSLPIYLVVSNFQPEWGFMEAFSPVDYTLLFIAAGLMGIVTYAFMPLATKHTDLTVIAMVNSLRPMLSFFIGIAFFSEDADTMKILAGITGIGASLGYSSYLYLQHRQKAATTLIPPA